MLRSCVAAASLIAGAQAHAGLYIPTARNAEDRDLPMFSGGKSPSTPCTCANGLTKVSPPKAGPVMADAAGVEATGCWSDLGMNYNSHAHQIKVLSAPTAAACCASCSEHSGCKFFTYVTAAKSCYLKNSTAGRSHMGGAVSGGSGTKPSLPPISPADHGKECDMGLRVNGGGQPCLWWSQGCSIGCDKCATDIIGPTGSAGGAGAHKDKIGFR